MPKIKFLASVNVEAALLAPEKLLLLPPGRERKSKLIFFIPVLWVQLQEEALALLMTWRSKQHSEASRCGRPDVLVQSG